VIARAGNRMRELTDPTAHAEMLAIRAACGALGTERLTGCDLWVTLEPCPACAGAISAARLSRLYYGAPTRSRAAWPMARGSSTIPRPMSRRRSMAASRRRRRQLLRDFFRNRRG
jgi:tRNA(adenine34) deaminase